VKSTIQKRLNLPTKLGDQHVLTLKIRDVRWLNAPIKQQISATAFKKNTFKPLKYATSVDEIMNIAFKF